MYIPIALTIAGSDSGGGAGIQADLRTFFALGVHGTSAITCVTAQNPKRIHGLQPIAPEMVRAQIYAVFDRLRPAAVKTGMLYSSEIIRVIAEFFRHEKRLPLVVDPVMVSTSGTELLKPSALQALKKYLFPLATLITPNLPEAEILTGRKLRSLADLNDAARALHGQFGCAILVKGGHLPDKRAATDIFYDGQKLRRFSAPRITGLSTHGTGCTYSAAIVALLARGHTLPRSVALAKRHVTRAIKHSYTAAGHPVLQPLPCASGAEVHSHCFNRSRKVCRAR